MDDNTGIQVTDALTKLRRERRRLLIGGGISGSLMLTLPSRRLLAKGSKKKNHGSIWCSFCNTKKGKGSASHTPITQANCGDSCTTWLNDVGNTNSNDCPVGWDTMSYEQYFPRPSGCDLYYSSTPGGTGTKSNSKTVTFGECVNNQVYYMNHAKTAKYTHCAQAACGYVNSKYYTCNGVSYFYGKQTSDVQHDFNTCPVSSLNSL